MARARLDEWIDWLVVALPVAHWFLGRNQLLLHSAAAACVAQLYREGFTIHGLPSWLAVAILNVSRPSGLAVLELLAFLLIGSTRLLRRFLPVPVFPPPMFPAHVGIRHLYWDSADGKHRGADVFYPAQKVEGLKRHMVAGRHGRKFLKHFFRTQNKPVWFSFLMNHLTKVPSNSYEDAPVAVREGARRHPVLIFSPGLYGSPEIYTYFCESLASMGMVVACVRHTDRSSNFIGADGEVRHAYEYMNWDDERRTGQVHERVADVMDLVRHLERTNKDAWGDKLDLATLAIAGHSFGGSTVVRCLTTTDRFRCGVVLDGWFLPIAKLPIPEPAVFQRTSCLFVLSPIWQPPKGLERIKKWCRMAPQSWAPYFITNSTHHAYDDIPLWLGSFAAVRLGMEHRDLAHQKASYIVAETAFDFLTQTTAVPTPLLYHPTAPRPELVPVPLDATPPASPRAPVALL